MKTTIRYINLFVVIQCFLFNSLKAQTKHTIKVDWKIAAVLPAKSNDEVSLGFAGNISGQIDELVIVAGGANFPIAMPWVNGKKVYYDDIYLFIKKDEQLSFKNAHFKLPEPIAYSAVTTTKNSVIYAGGESENGLSKKVFAIQNSKTGLIISPLPDLPLALSNAALVNINSKLYLAGGETEHETSNHLLVLDLEKLNEGWGTLKNIPIPVSHTVMVQQRSALQDKLYLLGGRTKTAKGVSEFYSTVFEYDILMNSWNHKKPLPYPIAAGTGAALDNKQILLFGGDKGVVFNKVEKLIIAINNEKDSIKKKILNDKKIQLQNTHPGFSNDVLLYNSINENTIKINEIPFAVPVTTNVLSIGEDFLITSGEIRAGVRAPYILLGKIKSK